MKLDCAHCGRAYDSSAFIARREPHRKLRTGHVVRSLTHLKSKGGCGKITEYQDGPALAEAMSGKIPA